MTTYADLAHRIGAPGASRATGVVEGSSGFRGAPGLRLPPEVEKAPGVEQGIGVAFETARIPREVDEQSVRNAVRVSYGAVRNRAIRIGAFLRPSASSRIEPARSQGAEAAR